jgi:poly-beta-1,6-N-acetyl-D-glucosamine synthase
MSRSGAANQYVLVTAAYNEAGYIEKTIRSMVGQTLRPLRWIVVSDGSTDRTDAIVSSYAREHAFIQLHRLTEGHKRNFGAQVDAINAGCAQLQAQALDYAYIGNLDADICLEADYFADLLRRFESDPQLGLAGGFICEADAQGVFRSRPLNSVDSVAHAVQLFRRECFDAIGGYLPLKYGGPDWHAGVMARMKGWSIRSFPDLHVQHLRPTGSADHWRRDRVRQGRMDYSMGSHPVFELVKCARRFQDYPKVLGALVRFSAFVWCYCVGEPRPVSQEFMKYLRKEQMDRVWAMFWPRSPKSAAAGSAAI